MRHISGFPIGRGEVYVERQERCTPREVVEVITVKQAASGGRSVWIATHAAGHRVPGTERIVFSAGDFLRSYRPATVADFAQE